MDDFLKLAQAALGWGKEAGINITEFSEATADKFVSFLKRAFWRSLIGVAIGTLFIGLSQVAGAVIFNTFGILIIAAITVFWIFLTQPFVVFGEQLAKVESVRRVFDRLFASILFIIVTVLLSTHMPAGLAGIQQLSIILLFALGALAMGFGASRWALGFKIMAVAVYMAAAVFLPRATENFDIVRENFDREVGNVFAPPPNEVEISLSIISGVAESARRLFVNGKPNVWCRPAADRDSGFKCFDQSQNDPITNEALTPISSEMVEVMKRQLHAVEVDRLDKIAQQEAEKVEKQRLEQARLDAEAAAAEKAAHRAYIERYLSKSGSKERIAVAVSNGSGIDQNFASEISDLLKDGAYAYLFTDKAVLEGVFDRLFVNDNGEFQRLEIANRASQLVLIKIQKRFAANSVIKGATNASVEIEGVLIDSSTRAVLRQFSFATDNVGYTENEAFQKAKAELAQRIATALMNNSR